jgi:hypothetical protein
MKERLHKRKTGRNVNKLNDKDKLFILLWGGLKLVVHSVHCVVFCGVVCSTVA